MGNYAGNGRARAIDEGRQIEVWSHEVVTVTETPALATSGALRFTRTRGVAYPMAFSVELAFDGAPGNFECDILTADTDDISRFVKRGTLTQADLNSSNVCRAEFTSVWCLYAALQMVSIANAVPVTGLVTR
jgi:hypothetical protein